MVRLPLNSANLKQVSILTVLTRRRYTYRGEFKEVKEAHDPISA